ncbi:phosphoribosylamine--glycine ligase [Candidatus Saccharibacteria bacterium]|nr:phosphoribosylamine--glycine ligase [Candidatus Saccharibacteria bacterium]
MAKVLIVGGEGRAHALSWKIAQSPLVEKVYFAPGNGGTSQVGENIDINVSELNKLADFAKQNKIDLTVVSPEMPLAEGIVDLFEKEGLKIFGPSKAAAKIETSKVFSDSFLKRHKIPYPDSTVVSSLAEAKAYVRQHPPQSYVIKADGLAGGKGVILPETQEEAETALGDIMAKKIFGDSGNQIVFQERLRGQEVSTFALSDGENILMLPYLQDHKRIYDGDKGPNTGGVGAYTPVPFMTDELDEQVQKEIIQATVDGMRSDGRPYKGVLYGGLFITEAGDPKVIEFNCRFGDPECQPMMRVIDEDIYPLLMQSAEGRLTSKAIRIKPGAAVNIVLTSGGYPGSYQTDYEIMGLNSVEDPDVVIFHAGTKNEDGKILTNGGRVLNVTAYGKDLKNALAKAYAQIGPSGIHFKDMHFRTDIGFRVLNH